MPNNELIYIVILLLSFFIASLSQVLLKKSANKTYKHWIFEFVNPLVVIAYIIFFLTTLATIVSYTVLPLSYGPVFEASSYVYVTIWGTFFFKEKITVRKSISILLIILGIVIYSV